nr:penicillin-binding protein activator [Ectothiorhodospira variabilis]
MKVSILSRLTYPARPSRHRPFSSRAQALTITPGRAILIMAMLMVMAAQAGQVATGHTPPHMMAFATAATPESAGITQSLADARASLDAGNPMEALRRLPWHTEGLPDELHAEALDIRAGSEAALGRILDAIKTWHTLYTAGFSADHSVHARRSIQDMLRALPPGDVTALKQRARNPVTLQWLNDAQPESYSPHRSFRTPTRPMGAKELPQGTFSEHVAVILPLSGRYANLAQAVLSGVKASHEAVTSSQRPRLSVYDMGDSPESAWQKYQKAVEAGADIVIGPLTKEAVSQLTDRQPLPVPTLVLNQPEGDIAASRQVILFSLQPEQEAARVADRAYARGHRRAAILAPRSSLGERLASAFSEQFTQQGGRVASVQHYAPQATDFQAVLGRILAQNVDMLFLVASPEQARMIQPQLRYLSTRHPPVYATSHVFDLEGRASQDADLDGITFPDMPAMLGRSGVQGHARLLQQGNPLWPRLVAMGFDAFAMIPELAKLQQDPQASHTGLTGQLRLDSQGRVVREPHWAHFRNGRPIPVHGH